MRMNKLVRWTSATLIVMGAALCVGCDDESGGVEPLPAIMPIPVNIS